MKNIIILIASFIAFNSYSSGKLQDADFKTEADLLVAGGTAALLLNDTKIYVTSVAKTLDDAIADGDIGGGGSVATKGDIQGFSTVPANISCPNDGEFLVRDDASATGWKCSNQLQGVLNPITDVTEITPVIRGTTTDPTFGTTTVNRFRYNRIGSHLYGQIKIQQTTAGTSGSGGYYIELPAGLTIKPGTEITAMGPNYFDIGGTRLSGPTYVSEGTNGISVLLGNKDNTFGGWNATSHPISTASYQANLSFMVEINGWTSGLDAVVQNKLLRKVRARKTTSQALADNTQTVINFDDEVEDHHNMYNSSTGVFTCSDTGSKFRVGYNVYLLDLVTPAGSIVLLNIINNTTGVNYELHRDTSTANFGAKNASTAPFDFECVAGETWSFRALCNDDVAGCSTRASSGNNYYNTLSITELPDSAVIAGTFGKCQKKFLSANITTDTTNISDLRFNNLVPGAKYSIKIRTKYQFTVNDSYNFYAKNNGVDACYVVDAGGLNHAPIAYSDCRFTAASTTLTFNVNSIASSNILRGGGADLNTWVELCTDNRSTTTEWN